MTGTVLLVAAGTLVSTAFNPFGASKRAQLARHLNNIKQVKFACDGFAIDFDGQYPNADTGQRVAAGGLGDKFSNNYFRQLLLTLVTQSEEIFWVKGASVCNEEEPDNVILKDGKPDRSMILKPGDCGWAYVTEQTNTSDVARPLLLDAYKAGTKEFDRKLWDDKVIVCRIDGSVKPMPLDENGKVLEMGQDLLTGTSKPWKDSGEEPADLLRQPEPPERPEDGADEDADRAPPE